MKSKALWLISIFCLIALGVVGVMLWGRGQKTPKPQEQVEPAATPTTNTTLPPTPTPTPVPKPTTPPAATPVKNPTTLLLSVPFTPQAPTGNWDELHNEACEEASAIMAAAYFAGDTRAELPAAEVEKQIATLTTWQQTNFGYSLDTTAAETAEMIRSVYKLKAELVTGVTESKIKAALLANQIVIVLVNGRLIGNPYYKAPGPIYHMLVVRGFTSTRLVTNDPGTKRGENYSYDFATIINATVDWDHTTDTIDDSKSVMIVVSK